MAPIKDMRKRVEGEHVIKVSIGERLITETIEDNIQLSNLSPESIIKAMNVSNGKLAYYGALRADAKRLLSKLQTDFELWFVKCKHEVSKGVVKQTDKATQNKAILANMEEYGERKEEIRKLEQMVDKLWVLYNAFVSTKETLQSTLSYRRTELASQIHGEEQEDS
jgi:hypothetical protein